MLHFFLLKMLLGAKYCNKPFHYEPLRSLLKAGNPGYFVPRVKMSGCADYHSFTSKCWG